MSRRKPDPWLIAAIVGGLLYPPLVYFGLAVIPPMCLVLVALALIGIRLLGLRGNPDIKIWNAAFLIAAVALLCLLFIDARLAVKAYPVIISLSVSVVFGVSLLYPPTMVERIARLTEPDLPPSGVVYTRRVTAVWAVFLLINALISTVTAIWGSLAQWTLWNGFVSYILIGMLFIGEWIVRGMVRR